MHSLLLSDACSQTLELREHWLLAKLGLSWVSFLCRDLEQSITSHPFHDVSVGTDGTEAAQLLQSPS